MSYAIDFVIKMPKTGTMIPLNIDYNITYNIRDILVKSSNCEDVWTANGLIPILDLYDKFQVGLVELETNIEQYRKYEPSNGWGNCENVLDFYRWFFDSLKDIPKAEYTNIYLEIY